MKNVLGVRAALIVAVALAGAAQAATGPGTLRIQVVAAGRDTGVPPKNVTISVQDVQTAAQLASISTIQMTEPDGTACPGVLFGTVCSADSTLTVNTNGSPLRVSVAVGNGDVPIYSGDCIGSAGSDDVTRAQVTLAAGQLATCLVTFVHGDSTASGPKDTALFVTHGFDYDRTGFGIPDLELSLKTQGGLQTLTDTVLSHLRDLNAPQLCPLHAVSPTCEWAVTFDEDLANPSFQLSEATNPEWLSIYGGDCDRGGGLPTNHPLGGRRTDCTIYDVHLEEKTSPTANADLRLEVIEPGEIAANQPALDVDVQDATSPAPQATISTIEMQDATGNACPRPGAALCNGDVGVQAAAAGTNFVLTVDPATLPAGATVAFSQGCQGGSTLSGFRAQATILRGQMVTCRLTVTLAPALLSVGNVSVVEGDSGTTSVSVPVTLSRARTVFVGVAWATANGSALAGSDYVGGSGTLKLEPGQTSATIKLSVLGDILGEPKETFFVNLSNPGNAAIGDGQGVVSILNDDDTTPPEISAHGNVLVESAVTPVRVLYALPTAKDALDGAVPVSCSPASGSNFALGTTHVTCSASDKNGNVATSSFDVVVQAPTTKGAVTNPGNDTPLTKVAPGRRVEVSAGGFAPGSPVTLIWVDASGARLPVATTCAGSDGRFDVLTKIPKHATRGPGQMTALGSSPGGGDFVRGWSLEVVGHR